MPNAVLEAMAAGLPVIATRIAGSEELVIDGVTGRLVPPENEKALEEALQSLILNSELRRQMGINSLGRVRREYSWE
ncbi:MAG: glycosyltransferase, partial [Anaerolineales bacterium]